METNESLKSLQEINGDLKEQNETNLIALQNEQSTNQKLKEDVEKYTNEQNEEIVQLKKQTQKPCLPKTSLNLPLFIVLLPIGSDFGVRGPRQERKVPDRCVHGPRRRQRSKDR